MLVTVLPPEEPAATGWTPRTLAEIAGLLGPRPVDRPWLIAVDGRSASGKTTFARRLATRLDRAALVHTDDLAWWEPFFEWGHLLRQVAELARSGQGVALRPPAWQARGREGQIQVPPSAAVVIIEGVGAAQLAVAELLDAVIWVQTDTRLAERRGIERDLASGENGDHDLTIAFWHEWQGHELPFLATDRPWTRADLVVAGGEQLPDGRVLVAPGPLLADDRNERSAGPLLEPGRS